MPLEERGTRSARAPLHRFESPWRVAQGLLAGKSLMRTLFNLSLSRLPALRGDVLDLGSKSAEASYYRHLARDGVASTVLTDMEAAPNVVALNIEEPFPFADGSFDSVLAFHVFEHVFHCARAVKEIARVLRPGGQFFVSVPFLHEFHADPDDFHRFTDSALRRLCEEQGLETLHLEAIGEGLATLASTKLVQLALPRPLRALGAATAYLAATGVDRLAALRPQIDGRTTPVRFALEHVGVFTKSA